MKLIRKFFTRRMLVALMLIIQIAFFLYIILSGSATSNVLDIMFRAISIIVSVHIISSKKKGAFKLTWVFLLLLFPVFGGMFYVTFYFQTEKRRFIGRSNTIDATTSPLLYLPGSAYEDAISDSSNRHINQIRYLQSFANYPVYDQSKVKFLPSGESMHAEILQELEKAQKYIFLEFFIINDGKMWGSILDVLKRKAKQGVDVRLIFDDMGCFFRLPQNYPSELKRFGIKSVSFNKFRPVMTVDQNNRDHRKIIVIDGKTAFTGGVNLADEYINELEGARYGHWKDSGVVLHGKAAWSFTVIFLRMWALASGTQEDYSPLYPWHNEKCTVESDGLVLPYADSPIDDENVGEHVYLQIIETAQSYVYISTPYLIVDGSMISALCLAAKSGVDVRIVTPLRWDKRLVHMTTRSYYRELIRAGVKIYEYSKGFVHSKTMVSDDCVATVGTTNLDFRSLYLHYECGVWLYKCNAVSEVKKDFLDTLEQCREITEKDCHKNLFSLLVQDFLRIFAPLM